MPRCSFVTKKTSDSQFYVVPMVLPKLVWKTLCKKVLNKQKVLAQQFMSGLWIFKLKAITKVFRLFWILKMKLNALFLIIKRKENASCLYAADIRLNNE